MSSFSLVSFACHSWHWMYVLQLFDFSQFNAFARALIMHTQCANCKRICLLSLAEEHPKRESTRTRRKQNLDTRRCECLQDAASSTIQWEFRALGLNSIRMFHQITKLVYFYCCQLRHSPWILFSCSAYVEDVLSLGTCNLRFNFNALSVIVLLRLNRDNKSREKYQTNRFSVQLGILHQQTELNFCLGISFFSQFH